MRRSLASLLAVLLLSLATTTAQAKTSAARLSLNKVLPQAKFINISLVDAINFLHDTTNANLDVDWKSLEAASISKDTQINLNVRQVRLGKVLQMVLNEAAPGDLLTYYIDENVIHVTTKAVADTKMITIVYYVEDIISQDLPFDPTINVGGGSFANGSASTVGNGQTGSGSGSQGGLFASGSGSGSGSGQQQGNKQSTVQAKADHMKALIAMIVKTVRPEIWKDNGGTAVIDSWNGSIIVTAPRSVHELIGGPVD